MKQLLILLMLMAGISIISCKDSEPATNSTTGTETSFSTENSEDFTYEPSAEAIEHNLGDPKIALFNQSDLQSFYGSRNFSPVWQSSATRSALVSELRNAEEEGLRFQDYHGEKINNLLNQQDLSSEEASTLDILLSDAFLSYGHDLYYGKLDPKELHEYWGVERDQKDLTKLLKESAEGGKVQQVFTELRPNNETYAGLKRSLKEYKKLKDQEKSFNEISSGDLIKAGQKDERVPAIAERLRELGFLESANFPQDNTYTDQLQAAVKSFQEKQDLQADGIVGNSTIAELNMSATDRYKQILANLERWRWYPRDLGDHYVLVNIADFRLAVVKDGDTVREHKVVAGTKQRKTPNFSDTLQYIVINPKWHIPPTIKTKDVIPKAKNDPDYLRRNNMQIISAGGDLVDPSSINWNSSEPHDYNYVQVAGPTNPLGRVKIIYPNKYLIYLHDTPAQSLFSQSERAESSGCVRVENAVDLAAYVVKDQNWSEERIRETISKGTTTQVEIDRPIQVHHFYWTAWRADGKTKFTGDIYEMDEKIYSRLLRS